MVSKLSNAVPVSYCTVFLHCAKLPKAMAKCFGNPKQDLKTLASSYYSAFQLSATEMRYLGAQPVLKVRRALGRVSGLQLQTTAIRYNCAHPSSFVAIVKR